MRRWWAFALLLFAGGCLGTPSGEIPSPSSHSETAFSEPVQESTDGEVIAAPVGLRWEDVALPSAALWETSPTDPEAVAVVPPFRAEDAEAMEERQVLEGPAQTPPEDEGETVPAESKAEAVTFDFPVVENDKVRYFIDYYTGRGRRVFTRWLERSGRYLPMMQEIFEEEGLPLDLTYLALVESGFNPRAYSWAHAAGPWQFIPSTGRMFGMNNDWWRDERRDYEKSTRAAARFLKQLYNRFDDWYLAVAGYNAGGGKINRAIRRYNTRDFWEISHGSYLQPETKNYIPKLLATILIAKQPEKYGFTDIDYQEPLAFETVTLPTATDLEVVADLCGVSYETVKDLNPELKRWCSPPAERDYRLRIPAGTKEAFSEKYARIPEGERANYLRHQIKKGDTLGALAQRYRIRTEDIMALNSIRNPRALRVGADLILPLNKKYDRQPLQELDDDYNRTRRQAYTVRQGDSLWKISRRFGVTEKQLRVWNRLGWSNVIRPGQRLVVSSSAASSRVAKTSGSQRKTVYTVRQGDSLWKISRRFGVTEKQLRTWNSLGSNVIRPGQKLLVSASAVSDSQRKIVYQVRRGDTLWDIGRQFEVPTRKIMHWNKLDEGHVLRPGDKLTLLVGSGSQG